MLSNNRLFLAAAIGILISLAGLIWDAQIHILEHGSLAIEPLLNLSEPAATNPGHLVFGLGFLLTTGSVLAGFTTTRVQNYSRAGSRWVWKALALPLAMSLLFGAVGLAAVYFLGQTS